MFLANYSDGLSDLPLPGHDRVLPRPRRPWPASSGVAPTSSFHLVQRGGRRPREEHLPHQGRRDAHQRRLLRPPPGHLRLHRRRRGAGRGALPAAGRRGQAGGLSPRRLLGLHGHLQGASSCSRTSTRAASRPGRCGERDRQRNGKATGPSRLVSYPRDGRSLEELLDSDLGADGRPPRGASSRRMEGSNLLITGGGGFLGYYLVQSVLFWNEQQARAPPDPRHRRRQLSPRRAGLAARPARRPQPRAAASTTSRSRCPPTCRAFQYIIHAAGIASPTYYRRFPIETMDANVNGLRHLLDYARARAGAAQPGAGLPLLLEQRDLRRSRRPANIPTPENYRGNVSCTGPARLLRRVEALRRDAVRQLRPAARPAGHDGPSVQQLRPGPEDHRPPRDPRLRARRPRRPRHRHALRRLAEADVLLRRRRGRRATTRCWSGAGPASRTTSASRRRRSPMRELAERIAALGRELFGYRGKVVSPGEQRGATTWSTTRTAAARSSTRRGRELGYDPAVDLDEGLRRSLIWYCGQPRRAGGADEGLHHRHRLRRPGHRRLPGRERPRGRLRRRRRGARWRRSSAACRPSSRRASRSCCASNLGTALRGDDRPRGGRARLGPHPDRRRHAVRRRRRSTSATCAQAARRDRRGARATSDGYHVVVVKSTVVPGHHRHRGARRCSRRPRASGPARTSALGMNPEFLTEGEAVRDFMAPDRIVLGGIDERALDALDALYAPFRGRARIRTNPRTAEMIKYASNALLATAISFSNEIANLCAALGGVDVVDVMEGVHASSLPDRRRPGRHARPRRRIASFLLRRLRLRRQLPAQGREGAGRARRGRSARRCRCCAPCSPSTRRSRRQVLRLLEKHFRRPARACASACWASPSSPTPTTCASRRRFPSSGCCWRGTRR